MHHPTPASVLAAVGDGEPQESQAHRDGPEKLLPVPSLEQLSGWELAQHVRTCLCPAGALSIGIPLPKVLRIPLVNVDFQIKAVSAGMGCSLLQGTRAVCRALPVVAVCARAVDFNS